MGRLRGERGAGTAEYVAVLALAALIVTAVAETGIGQAVGSSAVTAVCRIFGQECAGLPVATAGGPAGDDDGDGMSNADEVRLGTSPVSFDASFPTLPPPPPPPPDSGSGPFDSEDASPADHAREALADAATDAADVWGFTDAARHLRHYLDASGETLQIDVERLVEDEDQVRDAVTGALAHHLRQLQRQAQERYSGERLVIPFATEWRDTYTAPNTNWFFAMGGFSYAYTGTLVIEPSTVPGGRPTAHVEYRMHVLDYYNWDKGKSVTIGGVTVTDEQLQELHRAGLAREFTIEGISGTVALDVPLDQLGTAPAPAVPDGDDREGDRDDPGRDRGGRADGRG